MRTFSRNATAPVQDLLARLAERPEPQEYRDLMVQIGEALALAIHARLRETSRVLLICTNEDADFLAKGILEGLERQGCPRISLACFWNDRKRMGSLEVAPIVRRYVEPAEEFDVFVVVKSVISSGCVVRTNISEIVHEYNPHQIIVATPVIRAGAIEDLESDFDDSLVKRFEYIWFAQDDQINENGELIPGVGGSVYELEGIGTQATKNSFVPELIKNRRAVLL